MKDYFTAIDEMAKEPFVDSDRLGCVGASFGGFLCIGWPDITTSASRHSLPNDGIFNMEMQYLETEEKWFANWDMGGAYWEKQNPTANVHLPILPICLSKNGILQFSVSTVRKTTASLPTRQWLHSMLP